MPLRTTAALVLLATSSAAQWQTLFAPDGSKPKARHEAAYVEQGGELYLVGGRGSRPVNRYDPAAGTWADLGNPPLEMHHLQPVVWNDDVYVVCAFTGPYPNETPIPNVWIYDPPTNTWTQGPAIPAARNRGAAGVVVYQDDVYVVGGNTQGHAGGYVPWLDRYDPATNTWTALADAPHARDHFTAVVIGNKLYAAGGRQTTQPNPFVNTIGPVDVYDFTAGTWSSLPEPLPTLRAGTMTVARGEHLVVVGGESTVEAHDETEALDVLTGEWIALPLLNQGRHSGGAVLHQDAVYCVAGAGAPGGSPELNSQERLALTGLLGPSPANLLVNADFDAGQASWEDHGDLALSGTGGIAAPALDVANGYTSQDAAGAALVTYALRGVHQAFGTTGTLAVALEFLDGGGAQLGAATLALAPAAQYTSFELRGTSPAGTATLRVRAEAGGDRTLRVDDLVLTVVPGEVPRLGVPANPLALLPTGAGPKVGQVWSPAIDHATFLPGATSDVLAVAFQPLNVPSAFGTLLLGPAPAFTLSGPAGAAFPLPVPADPMFVGGTLVAQGASLSGLTIALTNALDLTIQAP
jgi:hypothetical protein